LKFKNVCKGSSIKGICKDGGGVKDLVDVCSLAFLVNYSSMFCRNYLWIFMADTICGMWWRIGWVNDFQPEGCGFDSRYSCHGQVLYLQLPVSFGVKLQYSIRAVVGSASE